MITPTIFAWAPVEWELARSFYCRDTLIDESDTWLQQAKKVQAHWNKYHKTDPGADYIRYRLQYPTRLSDFQWVVMLFSTVEKETPSVYRA